MHVLVTGGAGFIGSHLAEHYRSRASVRVLDNLRSGYRRNLRDGIEWIDGDVRDREVVRRAMSGVDLVFHLAAMVSVPESMHEPIECNEINLTGLLTVLEEAERAGVGKLVFSSSAAVYGDDPSIPKREGMLPDPKSPYAITKLAGEHLCTMFHREGRLATACLRYFNVFGPRQDPTSQYAAAISRFIARALAAEPLVIDGDGEQTRDFVFVADVVAANAWVAEHADLSGVFNVGTGRGTSVKSIAERVLALTGSRSSIRYGPPRPGDVAHSVAALDALAATGFRPISDLNAGLAATVEFFRALG